MRCLLNFVIIKKHPKLKSQQLTARMRDGNITLEGWAWDGEVTVS